MRLENENKTLSLDTEKFENYVAGLAKWNSDKEANLHVLAEELQQRGMHPVSLHLLIKPSVV